MTPVREAYAAVVPRYVEMVAEQWQVQADQELVRRHLTGLDGPVLDLGCGPGHWTGFLHAHGADVTGVDLVPEFLEHARAAHPGPSFRLASMTDLGLPDRSVAGLLSWYSTIHLPPDELDPVLAELHRLLVPGGPLVLGFFGSDDGVAAFDHAVLTAYRWPVDELAARLARAGFVEVARRQEVSPFRPDRLCADLVVRA